MLIEPNTRIIAPGPSTRLRPLSTGSWPVIAWPRSKKGQSDARYREARPVRRSGLGRFDRADARRLHPDPEQIARLRPGMGIARPHGRSGRDVRALGPRTAPRPAGRDARNRAAAGAHAADPDRGPGQ